MKEPTYLQVTPNLSAKVIKLCDWFISPYGGWETECGRGYEGWELPDECPHCGKQPFDVTIPEDSDDE